MDEQEFRVLERRAHEFLARKFLAGKTKLDRKQLCDLLKEELSIGNPELHTLITRLEEFALLYHKDDMRRFTWQMSHYEINPAILEEHERLKADSKPDRVERAYRTMRSHPVWSLLLISLVVITFIATLLNQSIELLDRFGWLGPR
jgi:hypothetical protein